MNSIDFVQQAGLPTAIILLLLWRSNKYLETIRKWRKDTLAYQLKQTKRDVRLDREHDRIGVELKNKKHKEAKK